MSVRVQSEQSFIRVIANATPVVHNILGTIPNKGTFPLADTKTGTITSTPLSAQAAAKKVVVGTGTLFRTEVFEGDYIYASDVVRKVTDVVSNTMLILESPLPLLVTDVALKVVRAGKYKTVLAKNTGPVDAIYNEAKLEIGDSSIRDSETGLAPLSYDVSTATAEITFELSE